MYCIKRLCGNRRVAVGEMSVGVVIKKSLTDKVIETSAKFASEEEERLSSNHFGLTR